MQKKIKHILPFATILVLFAALFATIACHKAETEKARAIVIPVETGPVHTETFSVPVRTSGRLFPRDMAKLSFKTGGIISRIPVAEGQTVKAGTLLAILDTREIDANVTQALEAHQKAKRDLQRATSLFQDKAATLEQLQDATTAANMAEARLDIAQFNLRHSRVTAPADGVVLKRLAEENETVGPGYPVILFGSLETRWVVRVGVTESQLIRLAVGDRAEARFDAYPGETFPAAVTEKANAIDPASQTYEVELSLESGDKALAAGFVAKAEIFPSQRETYQWVPISAMVEGTGNVASVFTAVQNRAQKIPIHIAHILDGKVLVSSGLERVGTIITEGAPYLTDGANVVITTQTESRK